MGTEHLHTTPPSHSELNHETTDVNLTGITRIAIVSLLVIVAILVFVYFFEKGMARFLTEDRPLPAMADKKPGVDRIPKAPLVVPDEPGTLRQLRSEEEQILNHYAWVDKSQGIVRIPIARALEFVAQNPALIAPQGAPPPATSPGAPAAATPAPPTPPPTPAPPPSGK
jgi:hypothetical protein